MMRHNILPPFLFVNFFQIDVQLSIIDQPSAVFLFDFATESSLEERLRTRLEFPFYQNRGRSYFNLELFRPVELVDCHE